MSFLFAVTAMVFWRSSSWKCTNSRALRICIAKSRLRCWLRSACDWTTIPVGRWVMRTADSVLLTCWPPAPLER